VDDLLQQAIFIGTASWEVEGLESSGPLAMSVARTSIMRLPRESVRNEPGDRWRLDDPLLGETERLNHLRTTRFETGGLARR